MQKPQHRAFLLVLLLWLAGLLAAGQFAKIAVPFAEVRSLYPMAGGHHGWLLSLVSLVGAVLGIVGGAFVSRFGAKRMLISGLLLGAGVSLWQYAGLGFRVMLLSRIVEGLSHLAIVIAAPTLIAAVARDRWRGLAMSFWSTFFGVGFAFAAWLAPVVVETRGLEGLYLMHGVAMVVLAPALAALIREADPSNASVPDSSRSALQIALNLGAVHRDAYRSPFVAAPATAWLFYTITFVALLALLPDTVPASGAWDVATAMPLVSIVVSVAVVPLLLQRVSAMRVVILGYGLAIGTLMLPFIGTHLALVAIALFAVLGLVQGASFAAVPELNASDASRALAYGAMAQTGNIGNLLGTPLLLLALSSGGISALLYCIGALYLAAIALLYVLRRARRGSYPNP